jgi:tetratricopeptide (TPR) repeat protein
MKGNDNKPVWLTATMFCCFLLFNAVANAQTDKKYIRQGNRQYEKNKFSESEILYRKAIDKNKQSSDAVFNTGDALYRQNKFEDAGKQFLDHTSQAGDKYSKAAGYYNLGNSLLKARKLQESIEAYKNSLKLNPSSYEAKYNLGYAQNLLKQQQNQQKQQQQDNDKKDQNKDKQDQNNKDQNNKDDKNQDQQKQQQDQQQQKQLGGMSKEDAERLLNALANEEKNVQEKVKREKAARERVRTDKNW